MPLGEVVAVSVGPLYCPHLDEAEWELVARTVAFSRHHSRGVSRPALDALLPRVRQLRDLAEAEPEARRERWRAAAQRLRDRKAAAELAGDA